MMMKPPDKQVKLTCPHFPDINSIHKWETAMGRILVATSVFPDQLEAEWFLESKTKTFDQLGDSASIRNTRWEGRFHQLDANLAQALIQTLPKPGSGGQAADLRQKVYRAEQELKKSYMIITGNQLAKP